MTTMELTYSPYGFPQPASIWDSKAPKYASATYTKVKELTYTDPEDSTNELVCKRITLVGHTMTVYLEKITAKNDWPAQTLSYAGRVALPRESCSPEKIAIDYVVETPIACNWVSVAPLTSAVALSAIGMFAHHAYTTLTALMDI